MGSIKGGLLGIIFGLIVVVFLFFVAHICQLFTGSEFTACGLPVIPFSLIAGIIPFSEKISYSISISLFLLLFLVIGIIFLRNR